jgi:hypothetical protein
MIPTIPVLIWLNHLSDEAIEVIASHMTNPDAPLMVNDIRHAAGVIAHGARSANAIGHRHVSYYLNMVSPTPTEEMYTSALDYFQHYKQDLGPYLHGGVFLNFLRGNEAKERAKDAYHPDDYQRLLALKSQYDPQNLFRHSFSLGELVMVQPRT